MLKLVNLSKQMAEKAAQIGADLWRQKKYREAAKLFRPIVVAFTIRNILDELGLNYRELDAIRMHWMLPNRDNRSTSQTLLSNKVVFRSSNPR